MKCLLKVGISVLLTGVLLTGCTAPNSIYNHQVLTNIEYQKAESRTAGKTTHYYITFNDKEYEAKLGDNTYAQIKELQDFKKITEFQGGKATIDLVFDAADSSVISVALHKEPKK